MFKNRKAHALLLICFFSLQALAQKTAFYFDKDALYKTGLDLFDKMQFVSA
jgi:hypothetical protein